MPGFRVTEKAKADLLGIARFTESKWGVQQRNDYLKSFDMAFHRISERPQLGKACDEIVQGYRKFPQGSHLVFFRTGLDAQVEIIRVLHQSMDVESRLSEEPRL
jgi:toxin ParE1/3/4